MVCVGQKNGVFIAPPRFVEPTSNIAKAFRGEFVPTEFELAKAEGRSFESAEELLARIRAANEARSNGNENCV